MDEIRIEDFEIINKPRNVTLPAIASLNLPRRDSRIDSSAPGHPAPDSACEILPEVPAKDKHYGSKTRRGKVRFSDPTDYDLRPPPPLARQNNAEHLAERLFSVEHLEVILEDTHHFHRFKSFLKRYRPRMVFTLMAYLESLKALTAVHYANALIEQLSPQSQAGSRNHPRRNAAIIDAGFENATQNLLDELVQEALPAYITHRIVGSVTECLVKEVIGSSESSTRELIQGLAEVYCLSDPNQPDNPIVFASEEFHDMTQYGRDYVLGRNCRFLQGPRTSPAAIARISNAISNNQDVNEVLLNYRRDGSPFLNLLTMAPLMDDRGQTRYFISAHVDITGVLEDGKMLSSFRILLNQDAKQSLQELESSGLTSDKPSEKLLRELRGLLNHEEIRIVTRRRPHHQSADFRPSSSRTDMPTRSNTHPNRCYVGIDQHGGGIWPPEASRSPLKQLGVYQNYLLVRPYPSLRIVFTSASLRIPGLAQSRLVDRIGGPPHVREEIEDALSQGFGVTAKIDWLPQSPGRGSYNPLGEGSYINTSDPNNTQENRPRWIYCTPLFGSDAQPGVIMVVMVDEEELSGSLVAPNPDLRRANTLRIQRQGNYTEDEWPIGDAIATFPQPPRRSDNKAREAYPAKDGRRASQPPTEPLQREGAESATRNASTTSPSISTLFSRRSTGNRSASQQINLAGGQLLKKSRSGARV